MKRSSVIATAMAAVEGKSRLQMRWADLLSKPSSPMASRVWLASCSTLLDWRARTESGSMSRRMSTVMDRVNTMPAMNSANTLTTGDTRFQMSTRPDSATITDMSISSVK